MLISGHVAAPKAAEADFLLEHLDTLLQDSHLPDRQNVANPSSIRTYRHRR